MSSVSLEENKRGAVAFPITAELRQEAVDAVRALIRIGVPKTIEAGVRLLIAMQRANGAATRDDGQDEDDGYF